MHVEDAGATAAVERLHDHLAAERLHESLQARGVGADEAVRDHIGEVERVELLVRVAEPARVVHDERDPRIDEAEDVRREEEGHVERRVLPHEDGVEPRERLHRGAAHGGELPRLRADAPHRGPRRRPVDEQVLDPAMVLLVPAAVPLAHEREGGVLVDEDPRGRIHHVEDAQRAPHAGGC